MQQFMQQLPATSFMQIIMMKDVSTGLLAVLRDIARALDWVRESERPCSSNKWVAFPRPRSHMLLRWHIHSRNSNIKAVKATRFIWSSRVSTVLEISLCQRLDRVRQVDRVYRTVGSAEAEESRLSQQFDYNVYTTQICVAPLQDANGLVDLWPGMDSNRYRAP